ncbi:hypothetical protein M8J76_013722 [Diaphorina citri]|nr:hypothetical protein M8J75_012859 [Diaphorina citri]KAI5709244.1 hypothetical protein M8J76_013722 [Diaphorina citri]
MERNGRFVAKWTLLNKGVLALDRRDLILGSCLRIGHFPLPLNLHRLDFCPELQDLQSRMSPIFATIPSNLLDSRTIL